MKFVDYVFKKMVCSVCGYNFCKAGLMAMKPEENKRETYCVKCGKSQLFIIDKESEEIV